MNIITTGSPSAGASKTKEDFINKAHEARQARELARHREKSATIIQSFLKSYHVRRKLKEEALKDFDSIMSMKYFDNNSLNILLTLRKVLFVCDSTKDRSTLDSLILFIITTSSQLNENDQSNNSNDNKGIENETPKSLLEDAIKESIELSSDHINTTADCVAINNIGHNNFLNLMIRSSLDEKNLQCWLLILEQMIKLCLHYLKDASSTRLDSQHIDYYLKFINLFTSSKPLTSMIEKIGFDSDIPREKYEIIIDRISNELFIKTLLSRRKSFFECITNIISERIGRFRNDLKTSILSNYVSLLLRLLKLNIKSHENSPPNLYLESSHSDKKFRIETLLHMLSIPGFVYNLEKHSPESLKELNESHLFKLIMKLLGTNQDFYSLSSIQSVCLLANIAHLASLNEELMIEERDSFVSIATKILESCQKNMLKVSSAIFTGNPRLSSRNPNNKKHNDSMDVIFNPVLGWIIREEATSVDKDILKAQLSNLWSLKFLKILFVDLIQMHDKQDSENFQLNNNSKHKTQSPIRNASLSNQSNCDNNTQSLGLFRRAVERATTTVTRTINSSSYSKTTGVSNSGRAKLMTPEAKRIASVCLLLHTTLKTLTTLKQDILSGLCLHDYILPKLWTYISNLGSNNGLKAFLEHLTIYTKTNSPEFHILILFCECASHLISILDDSELYEKQQPFQLDDLISISTFLNNFIYRIICNNLVPISNQEMDPVLKATHKLLTDLYKRDCRRKFATQEHWIIKDLKISMFMKDLEAGKPVAKAIITMIPHIIPHKDRVLIFRKLVAKDKAQYLTLTAPSTLITIHRSRIVEDGYQQLIRLPSHALKGLIRVKFINDFGLDEAGIDQDGVFKEFLEDTIKRVFDPALNLFCSTSEQRLYPSPTSKLHEDYLSLFNFVGKMLGKAVYEGIVVDVPFASFFLSRVLGQPQSPLYSPIDELPSLDPELYKSLTYIKHYEGNVSELELTFSIDQDFLGKIETHELEAGGKLIPVTRESRVRYIHSVANFRMKTQIEKQTEAFVNGFRSIINPEWLTMFSASEFQRLISGDNTPIDLQDLRRNTKYFGGFHNNHRVVCWLWDILEKDFSPEEHRLFLKFITSCSKPPLLGFSNLEPPFSIRCVEVSDDQDLGDTVGSVLRGFFAIRRSDPVDRLPTSSTCFNLLKLPNYQRRSTLREKLRYAIRSNPGFELS